MKIILLIIGTFYCSFVANENVKIFIPNTNYWNPKNWKDKHVPCSGNHITFPKKSPRVFLDGVSKNYQITEIILPKNGELILDDQMTITGALLNNEEHDCDTSVSQYIKVEPDRWYNPDNWCEAKSIDSQCLVKPQVEASIVPSAIDFVVFPSQNTLFLGIDSSEPRITVSKIFFRGTVYANSLFFRQKIRRTFSNQNSEFVNLNSTNPPLLELQGNRCRNNICAINSNLQKMETICKYVSCKTPNGCSQPVKPKGSCCHICGNVIRVVLLEQQSKSHFSDLLTVLLDGIDETQISFSILSVSEEELQLTLVPVPQASKDFQEMTAEIMKKIREEIKKIYIKKIECLTCVKSVANSGVSRALIAIIGIIVIIILLVILLSQTKRFRPAIIPAITLKCPWKPSFKLPTINLNFFRNDFSRSRLQEQYDDSTVTSSTFTNIFPGGVEAIELPDTNNEVYFDNPIYIPEIDDSKQ